MAFAGFTPGEAEGLRRAMSRRALRGGDARLRASSSSRARSRGASSGRSPSASSTQIVGFSGFGFPKSHSAAFGLLAYQSTWLRVHYGPEFLCALLNEQPMGFYPPDALVHEAQRRGIEILGPCATASDVRVHGRGGEGDELAVRIGLGYVNGVREEDVRRARRRARAGWAVRGRSATSRRAAGRGAETLEPARLGRAPATRSSRGLRRAAAAGALAARRRGAGGLAGRGGRPARAAAGAARRPRAARS